MPKWVCNAAAAAAWPVAMTIGIVLISPPVLAMHDADMLGGTPSAPIMLIVAASLALSMLLSASIWMILRAYCDYDEARVAKREGRTEVG